MSSSYEASGKSRLPLVETVQSVPVKLAMQPALQTNMWTPQKPSMQVEARQLLDSSRRALDKLVRRGTRTGTSRSSFNKDAAESARKVGPHPFVPYLCVSCCVPRSCPSVPMSVGRSRLHPHTRNRCRLRFFAQVLPSIERELKVMLAL
jgi:hypothetical protein